MRDGDLSEALRAGTPLLSSFAGPQADATVFAKRRSYPEKRVPRLVDIRRNRVFLLAVLAFCVACTATGEPAAALRAAAPTLYVSPTGSDSGRCTQSSPCASFDRAYRVASLGTTVQVLPGEYAAQTIRPDTSKTGTGRVVFAATASGQVQVGGVSIFGNHVELRKLQTTWRVMPGTTDVIIRDVVSPGQISITGATHVSVIGGEVYSPVRVSGDSLIASIRGLIPKDILIDGVSFHDWRDIGPGQFHHIECLQMGAGINVTIRNSTFHDCATHDLFIRSWGVTAESPSPLSNIVIENNWFGKTDGFYAMQVLDDLFTGTPQTSVTLQNNSSLQPFVVRVSHGTASVRGNILPGMSAFGCTAYGQNKWFDYNLYASGVPCGPHDRVGDPRFVDPAKLDLHLQPGSAALGRGAPLAQPTFDIDGKLRPIRALPDAGASQRETAEIDVKRSIGAAALGAAKSDLDGFYGAPRRIKRFRGKLANTIATYRAHGGALLVLYRNGTAVGIGTTSRYYNTLTGLGVGVPTKKFAPLKLRWGACKGGGYRRTTGSSGLYLTRSKSSKVTSIWVLRSGIGACPRLTG